MKFAILAAIAASAMFAAPSFAHADAGAQTAPDRVDLRRSLIAIGATRVYQLQADVYFQTGVEAPAAMAFTDAPFASVRWCADGACAPH